MNRDVVAISPEFLNQYLDHFLDIDKDTPGEAWTEKHFELDMPAKWEISRAILSDAKVVGFLIASQKGDSFHIHRLAIEKGSKGQKMGSLLIENLKQQAKSKGVRSISLKVHYQNDAAIGFYLALNFSNLEREGQNLTMLLDVLNSK